ncbi:PstS family phosphate ABC transporter substrate-binding protein [Microbacterium sp. CFBP9034]|uniref:PstS family phosphate ABC transporter substrate-binding protein n=1 Tax=Microbacterium sp. CFBP9034 TaxID=3096540 RepID=UPI002A6B272B|nr:PstS family phosphate ABC transporter substrate-binding protein [Microbacterium sp. CFBP9034]MDY0910709.1 PstS family phosphate ABC transporter substrate-binding protein [Microbacterium sp. CFBP9034]
MSTPSAGSGFGLSKWTMRRRTLVTASAMIPVAMLLSGCAGEADGSSRGLTGTVLADGSSTVAPLTAAARHLFVGVEPDVEIKNTSTGTSAGFRSLCSGITDISNASRPISDDEASKCADAGVDFTEILVANDGLSVIVNPENDWATDLTLEQLASIWAPESEGEVTNWNQVNPAFPDQPLALFGPGSDSGTLDFFTVAVNGEEGAIRGDYNASEDDNNTVAGVREDIGAIGFLGLSYVEENEGDIVAASVDGVSPSTDTVQDGSYAPLSRSLFIYVNNASYADKSHVKAFVDFYVENAWDIAERALFVPLTDEQILLAQDELDSLR